MDEKEEACRAYVVGGSLHCLWGTQTRLVAYIHCRGSTHNLSETVFCNAIQQSRLKIVTI